MVVLIGYGDNAGRNGYICVESKLAVKGIFDGTVGDYIV